MLDLRKTRWLAVFGLAALFACSKNTKSQESAAPDDVPVAEAVEPAEEVLEGPPPDRRPDVGFVPTPQEAVDKMLEVANIKKGERHYDLGCGDGRIVITAARKYGARAVGVDIDPERIEEATANVKEAGVEDLVTIRHADIFQTDFSDADVVTLYLLPHLNVKLMPKLAELKPGTRIISYEFDMEGAKPAATFDGTTDDGYPYKIYKWVVPWEEEEVEYHDEDEY
jgi:SAM-dependent methyltransferase